MEKQEQENTFTTEEKLDLLPGAGGQCGGRFQRGRYSPYDAGEEGFGGSGAQSSCRRDLRQRTADRIARFAGSWGFIFSFTALLLF